MKIGSQMRHAGLLKGRRPVGWRAVLLIAALGLATSCSQFAANPAFESVEFSPIECPDDSNSDNECILVVAPVVGTRPGIGACRVYTRGETGPAAIGAETGPIEIEPGDTVEWIAEIPLPDMEPYNPVCKPMMEG